MLHIAVCDDTLSDLNRTVTLMREYASSHCFEAEVAAFSHPDALLAASESAPFDLYLLDVVMPMLSGIDVGREVRMQQSTAQIIYLSTSGEFAVDAFSVRATHYLTKPFTPEQFDLAVDRAMESLAIHLSQRLAVKSKGGSLVVVDVNDIKYIESQNHEQQLHLQNSVCTEVRRSLARLYEELEKLAPGQFTMPCKGYLVNQRAIVTMDARGIMMRGGACIPIPRGSLRKLQAQYIAFRFERMETTT